ncbi:MAG: hypothetical protein M4579_000678 [Chaenotheca gracillima]|nr:MAG: hypothetical protein M4579_000678 [Chaenotheca gracillima]
MAPTSAALTSKVSEDSISQLSHDQTLKASKALLVHIKSEAKETKAGSTKQDLFALDDDDEDNAKAGDETPLWLLITTKKHVIDKARLKPGKIPIPHSYNDAPDLRICLITADPQHQFKDVVEDPTFPEELRSRISRVIGEDKIRKKYSTYESRRQLFSEHDVFLADDRVIVHLPRLLGKVFYKNGAKRPIPISISGRKEKKDTKGPKKATPKDSAKSIAPPKAVADEITRTLSSALVHLAPSTSTAVKIGKAGWDAEKVAANIEAAVGGLVQKFVPQKWKGLKAAHIKGPNTAALPIWLADELWTDENDVLEDAPAAETEEGGVKAIEAKPEKTKKRKAKDADEESKSSKKTKKVNGGDPDLAEEKKLRKEMLKKQKSAALEETEDEPVKKEKQEKTALTENGNEETPKKEKKHKKAVLDEVNGDGPKKEKKHKKSKAVAAA